MGNPTLTLSAPEHALTVSVTFDRWDGDRAQYAWTIEHAGETADGTDLRMGANSDPSIGHALRALLDFYGAFAESVEYERRSGCDGDNGDLFPAQLREPAGSVGSDALAMLAREAVTIPDDEE